ncbi:MAG TPA: Na+/H+ antiporter subunit B [Terriglobia bacterium]|nr:Na+/H+ antiporter subunit B [Terriglobia bacterium]
MISLILRTATRFLMILMLLFSLFLLMRGHNAPGGGFVGGLVAAAAFALYTIAYDPAATRRALRIDPRAFIGVGLLVAALSGQLSLAAGRPFMTGLWATLSLSGQERVDVGTPMLFDVGVYLVVLGVTLTILLSMSEE